MESKIETRKAEGGKKKGRELCRQCLAAHESLCYRPPPSLLPIQVVLGHVDELVRLINNLVSQKLFNDIFQGDYADRLSIEDKKKGGVRPRRSIDW